MQFLLNKKEFFDIWSNEEFEEAFAATESKEYETNMVPCNKCKYFKNKCYPCYLTMNLNNKREVKDCSRFFELIENN